jgi:hypothetical protein
MRAMLVRTGRVRLGPVPVSHSPLHDITTIARRKAITTVLYARSDVCSVTVPVSSGGCGGSHSRELTHGAPAKHFKLSCPPCEGFLRERASDIWVSTEADIPETPDETKGREDFQKRGATDRDNILAIAMAKLAGVELPQTMRQAISGVSPNVQSAILGTLICPEGHDAEPGSRYCSECGAEMRSPVLAACPDGHPMTPAAKFCSECGKPSAMSAAPAIEPPAPPRPARAPVARKAPARKPLRDMRAEDLRQIARDRGLSDSGSRLELIERIRSAKVPAAA